MLRYAQGMQVLDEPWIGVVLVKTNLIIVPFVVPELMIHKGLKRCRSINGQFTVFVQQQR